MLRRLEVSVSRVKDLDTRVSPLQEHGIQVRVELSQLLGGIKAQLDELQYSRKTDRPLTTHTQMLLTSTISKCEQLKTQMKSVVSSDTINTKADKRMFREYDSPGKIEDRQSWKKHSESISTRRNLHVLQEAVRWWEIEERQVANLVGSLKSSREHMEKDKEVLLKVFDKLDLDISEPVSVSFFTRTVSLSPIMLSTLSTH